MLRNIQLSAEQHALVISIVVVLGYFASFFITGAMSSDSFGRGETHSDIASMSSQLWSEVVLALSVLVLILILGWARAAHLTTPLCGRSLLWLVPPILFMGFLLLATFAETEDDGASDALGNIPPLGGLIALLTTVALVGIFEELLFRGLLFRGIESRAGPIRALFFSSIAFGLMHYVNWVAGQPFVDTTVQVIHAALGGFMYGAIMLKTGSIWPCIFLHGTWDGMVSFISTFNVSAAPELSTETSTLDGIDNMQTSDMAYGLGDLVVMGFEPIYGMVVFAAWIFARRRTARDPG